MILVNTERQRVSFEVQDVVVFKKKALIWAAEFELCCAMDSNQGGQDPFKKYETLIAAGVESELVEQEGITYFDSLQAYHEKHKDWLFGFLTYDLKNEVEQLESNNLDHLDFPEMHFFQPTVVLNIQSGFVEIHSSSLAPVLIFQQIQHTEIDRTNKPINLPELQKRFSKKEYVETVQTIRDHIIEGDIYEMNFCQEFYIENAEIDPLDVFIKLNELTKAPFSCFYKRRNQYLLCASPERYLKKVQDKLISQPIKGTIGRGSNPQEDIALSNQLRRSKKDQAENVMIVDLVRNDLARFCKPGSVQVEELFGIYPFEQVFQMISTISGLQRKGLSFVDALRNTFPMGSMTGAPKVMAMQLIEQYEKSKRGLYSGAVGYVTPDGDFDFNVVIRSILYNAKRKYLSFQVGGAIVYDSVPEQEYEECLLKAKAILEVLEVEVLPSVGSDSSPLAK